MMATSNGSKDDGGEQTRSDICRDFLRNVCSRGSSCKFLHTANAKKKLEFCHDYQNSQCMRRNCRFIHCKRDDEEYYLEHGSLPAGADDGSGRGLGLKSDFNEIPLCREFLNGKCSRGASCKYRHQSEGDMQHERRRQGGYSGGWEDEVPAYAYAEYGYERARRPPPSGLYNRSPVSRYGRLPSHEGSSDYYDFEPRRSHSVPDLEDENTSLKHKIDVLRKQVDDLTSTNEILLQQNAQLRTGKSDMSAQMQLAMMGQ